MRLMLSAWKFGLSNIATSWSAMPTLKFACAGAAKTAHSEERHDGEESSVHGHRNRR